MDNMLDRKTYSDAAYVVKFQASEHELKKWDMDPQSMNDQNEEQLTDSVKSDEFNLIHDDETRYLGDLALAQRFETDKQT